MPIKILNDFKKKEITEDNVIIGSGAGGSTTAYELLKSGKSSIILEEGPSVEFEEKKKGWQSNYEILQKQWCYTYILIFWGTINRLWSRFLCRRVNFY